MKKNENGFVIVGVMILAAMMVIGFFVALQYKKIVEKEIALTNVRHAGYIIEDSLRTRLAVMAFNAPAGTNATTARDNVINQIRQSTMTVNPGGYIRMAVPDSICDLNGRPCNVYVKEAKFVDNACDLTTMKSEDCAVATDATATKAILVVKAEHFNRQANTIEEKGAGTKELVVPIPRVAEIQNVMAVRVGRLECPFTEPIFRGTEIVTIGTVKEIRAKCAPLTAAPNSTMTCSANSGGSCVTKKMTCDTAGGYWLVGVNLDLSAKCQRFPEGTGVASPLIDLCPGGQVATGFKLNQKFQVSDIKCRDKGGPYDFEK